MQTFKLVSEAFSRQAKIFDKYEEENKILQWMRFITREHLMRHLKESSEILELNSGTGLDAVYLAEQGFYVYCIDIAEGMLKKLKEKISCRGLEGKISVQNLSYTNLEKLKGKQFDHIYSNFGGLNCANDLSPIFDNFKKVLKPGGKVTLVIIPPICPWEIALIFKGNFFTAFRRLHKKGITTNVEGVKFQTYYFSVKQTIRALGKDYKLIELQGLASFSPPPYMNNFPERLPGIYQILTKLDEKFSGYFPFNRWADHFILTAEYKPQ